ncbi:MAG TPA: amylo-alpha-1,6-glucosidase [Anditalea sp.]|nr:amylo-alpha-1,6-glucosidase [Anditalea sp.]
MSYIHFDKSELINLNYSLEREIIRSNKLGCYTSTTIIGCNTRKYHGLLVAPQPQIDSQLHVMLSTVHETIVLRGSTFNLGITKYPGTYSPRGHKYLEDFESEPIPKITFKVGGAHLQKEIILDSNRDRVMIRYSLLEAHSEARIRIDPFLAFRPNHQLSKANPLINKNYQKVDNGVKFQLYENYQPIYLQFSKENEFVHVPDWYYDVEYMNEKERGYDYHEDLYVPGYFEFEITKDEPVIFSAGLVEALSDTRNESFEREISRRIPRNNFLNCLKNSAKQFITHRDGNTHVMAGYPWFGWWGRDTFIALPGLTLTLGDKETFLAVMDTMSNNMARGLFPNIGSGGVSNMNSIDAPLWYFWAAQQYILFTEDVQTIKDRYLAKLKEIISNYRDGTDFNIKMLENGLIYGGEEGKALTWMDAVTKDGAVTPRIGCAVEINALWYNALCFYYSITGEEEINALAQKVRKSFEENFWDVKKGYLADVVENGKKDWSIRPNMVFVTSLPFRPLTDLQNEKILEVIKSKLLTNRGLRTLSPEDPNYMGTYEGTQDERDKAYHQGTVWPWLLGHFAEGYIKIHGEEGRLLAEQMINSFDSEMSQYGIGTVAELYDGDPPHKPKGAISQAWSVGELLRMMHLINKI